MSREKPNTSEVKRDRKKPDKKIEELTLNLSDCWDVASELEKLTEFITKKFGRNVLVRGIDMNETSHRRLLETGVDRVLGDENHIMGEIDGMFDDEIEPVYAVRRKNEHRETEKIFGLCIDAFKLDDMQPTANGSVLSYTLGADHPTILIYDASKLEPAHLTDSTFEGDFKSALCGIITLKQ